MKVLQDVVQQPGKGVSFKVMKGQVLRIIEVEGGQVGDLIAYNLHDFKERYSSTLTSALHRSFRKVEELYTIHSRGRVIFKIIDDTVGVHWIYGGRCCALTFLRRYGIQSYRGCHEVLVDTIAPYGLTGDDIGDVFNVFMNVIHHEDGSYEAKPPLAKKGDYIDLQAEMDALVAVSVCPADNGPTNNFRPTALQFQVLGD
jgi:uncharacterized protein